MGRGVMTHPRALVTVYADWDEKYEDWREWQIEIARDMDEEIDELDLSEDAFYRYLSYGLSNAWENNLEWFVSYCQELWPSLYTADYWPHNEVHVVLENSLVEISVSEYCGMTALCIAPREDAYGDYPKMGLATRWAAQIARKFEDTFGTYYKIGTFSNGESVYGTR